MALAYVGVGANLGNPVARVREGIERLRSFGEVLAVSSLYDSLPWGNVQDQPPFVNAVVLLETLRPVHELLASLKFLEKELGREDGVPGGPRSIDFDILTYDDVRIDDGVVTVPHPRMHQRAFVLVPLAEIEPSFAPMRDALDAGELASVTRRA